MPRVLKPLAIAAATLITAPTAGLALLLWVSLPQERGLATLPGLRAPVSVTADRLGVPVIQATGREDAYRALGYLHARDRLFQMDLMRRKAGGRLAEIFGVRAAALDQAQRAYPFERAAARATAALPVEHRAVLAAYVAGVNAYIGQTRVLPPEFVALGYRPEPWRQEDSLLVVLTMFQQLNGYEQDERMVSVMAAALPEPLLRFLTPDTDGYAMPLVGGENAYRPLPPIPVEAFKALDGSQFAAGGVDVERGVVGSNNWAVAGGKTADGRAMIANDMHLALNAPNIWYRAELQYPGHVLSGVTLPGLPLPVVGSSGYVAWGFTNTTADLLDLVSLELNPDNANQYRTPEGWRDFEESTAVVRVKNGEDILLRQRSTVWGPVSPQPLLGRPVVVRWTALEDGALGLGLIDMDQPSNVAEALELFNRIGGPPQNVVVADRGGHIGWSLMGRFPKRHGFDGLTSVSWADGGKGWDGLLPPEAMPRLTDPPEGFIVTANNRTLGRDYPYELGHNWALGYRAWRIAELLREGGPLDEAAMLHIQLDTRSELLEFYRQLALQAGGDAALRGWDLHLDSASGAAALLTAFRKKLAEGAFAKVVARCRQLDPDFHYAWREMEMPLRELLTRQPAGVLAAEYQDDWPRFIAASLAAASADLAQSHPGVDPAELPWGEVNRIRQQHPFSKSMPWLAGVLDIADFGSGGCASFCVKVMGYNHGATERLVVSPAHPEDGILEMPGGQSGHPFSAHYRDQQPAWQAGEPAPFLSGEVADKLMLQPEER